MAVKCGAFSAGPQVYHKIATAFVNFFSAQFTALATRTSPRTLVQACSSHFVASRSMCTWVSGIMVLEEQSALCVWVASFRNGLVNVVLSWVESVQTRLCINRLLGEN